jgi:hypothetical protein
MPNTLLRRYRTTSPRSPGVLPASSVSPERTQSDRPIPSQTRAETSEPTAESETGKPTADDGGTGRVNAAEEVTGSTADDQTSTAIPDAATPAGDDGRCIGGVTEADGEWLTRLVKGNHDGDEVDGYRTKPDTENAIRDAAKAKDQSAEKTWRLGLTAIVVKEMEESAKATKARLNRIKSATAEKLAVGAECYGGSSLGLLGRCRCRKIDFSHRPEIGVERDETFNLWRREDHVASARNEKGFGVRLHLALFKKAKKFGL